MKTVIPPRLEDFLQAPIQQVAAVAPTTMILAPGGTRREAVLAGISPQSEQYARWSREQMIRCADMLFRLGVQNLFVIALRSSTLAEVSSFRERIVGWAAECMAGPDALEDYTHRGWRVRLAGAETVPELRPVAEKLRAATPPHWRHTLWHYVSNTPDEYWSSLLTIAQRTGARTRSELVRAFYGEEVSPATLCLSWGKPLVAVDIVPPLIASDVQCYWSQRPGFAQTEETIRSIFYDYAYTRRTWQQDKSTRYTDVTAQRALWETPSVLGIGQRVGAFWYPIPTADVPDDILYQC